MTLPCGKTPGINPPQLADSLSEPASLKNRAEKSPLAERLSPRGFAFTPKPGEEENAVHSLVKNSIWRGFATNYAPKSPSTSAQKSGSGHPKNAYPPPPSRNPFRMLRSKTDVNG